MTAVITVLHRSAGEFAVLRASLRRQLPETRVIAVQTAEEASVIDCDVLVDRRDNPGFGAANIAGLEHVTEPVTILLNPDTELRDAGLRALVDLAAAHDALFVPRLVRPDGTQERSAHPLPGTPGSLIPALLPVRHPRVEPWRSSRARTVGWAVAAAVVARTETLRRLGPFDPRIHLFYEDMDLGLRARAAGVPTVFVPDVTVVHSGGHSHDDPHALMAQRRREVVRRHRGPAAAAIDETAQRLTFATRSVLGRDRARARSQLRAQLQ